MLKRSVVPYALTILLYAIAFFISCNRENTGAAKPEASAASSDGPTNPMSK